VLSQLYEVNASGHDDAIRSVRAAGYGLFKMPYGSGRLEAVGLCLPEFPEKNSKAKETATSAD
jgi:hypothetical protein